MNWRPLGADLAVDNDYEPPTAPRIARYYHLSERVAEIMKREMSEIEILCWHQEIETEDEEPYCYIELAAFGPGGGYASGMSLSKFLDLSLKFHKTTFEVDARRELKALKALHADIADMIKEREKMA